MSAAADGPLPAPWGSLARPLSWAYGAAVRVRNRRYDRGGGTRLAVPTVSVGNLTAGGTGKTPMVAWIARTLVEAGHRPVIAMRGYGARAGLPGDEELEYRATLPDVPIVARKDRFAAVSAYLARHASIDVVVLDDGFQHRQVARDLDLVLVDATRPSLAGDLLPTGWLREPAEALARADAVIVSRADAADAALEQAIRRLHGRPPIAWCRHDWTGLAIEGSAARREPVEWLRGRRLIGLFGVGHPESVAAAYRAAGAEIVGRRPAADHAAHDAATVAELVRLVRETRAEGVATTRKDWVKLAPHWSAALPPAIVPELRIAFLAGMEPLRNLLLERVGRSRG